MIAALVAVGTAAAGKSNKPTITFEPSSPAEGETLITDSVSFAFIYNRTVKQTERLVCSLSGPAVSSDACDAPVAGGSGTRSGKAYSGLDNGEYTFTVTLTLSNGGTASATRHFTVEADTTPPETEILSGPSTPTESTAATFAFEGADDVTANVSFECALDGGAFANCTTPGTFTDLALGMHSFQVRAIDDAGNIDPTPDDYAWTIAADATPPETTIDSGPPSISLEASATFVFSASEQDVTYECAVNGALFDTCVSPITYSDLGVGPYSFQVRAIDNAGNIDPTPASYTWEVSTLPAVPPDTAILNGPTNQTDSTGATFTFVGSIPGVVFECALDGGDWLTGCTSPHSYSNLDTGIHTFRVRAIDAGGLVDPTPASYTWEIIPAIPPDTEILSGPTSPTDSTVASFTFTSWPPGAIFECALDGGAWTAPTSPNSCTYTDLAPGVHTFQVRARDLSLVDPTPASFTWEVIPG